MNTTQLGLYDVAEIKLTYTSKIPASERRQISSSRDAFDLFNNNWDQETIEYFEQFKILLLNRANKVLGIVNISTGGVSGTVIDIKIIFQAALKANACSIILAHNHPSGNTLPSEPDKRITEKLKSAGLIMEIPVLDHLILVPGSKYLSLADEGLM